MVKFGAKLDFSGQIVRDLNSYKNSTAQNMLFHNHFTRILASKSPHQIILVEGNTQITAGQLWRESQSLALHLRANGVQKDQKVVILAQVDADFIRLIYANMMLGATIAIIDPEMGAQNFAAKFEQLKPDCVFIDSRLLLLREHPVLRFALRKMGKFIPDLPNLGGIQVFSVGRWLPILSKHKRLTHDAKEVQPNIHWQDSDPNEPFLITYTSGTLHEPKGVVHSCNSIFASLALLSEVLKSDKNTALATHLPHFALIGIQAGLTVYIWSHMSTPQAKVDFINTNQVTTLFGPPSDFMPLIKLQNTKNELFPSCLKTIFLGSAPVYPSFLHQIIPLCPSARVLSLYGMTEHLVTCMIDARKKKDWHGQGDVVGKPMPGVQITIADDGEICVLSDQLMLEYWGLPAIMRPHRTGDQGYIDSEGNLILTGRKKDMIIRDHFNLYPGLYEPTINKIPGITEAIFLGIYNPTKETEDVILVVEGEPHLSPSYIMNQLKSGPYSIDYQALPDKIIFHTLARSGRQSKVNKALMRTQITNEI
jgi:acyl-CoA synthetase (AMP-forming)/AMP-acid ligase II